MSALCQKHDRTLHLLTARQLRATQLPGWCRDSAPPPSHAHRHTGQRRTTACHIQKRPCLARPQTELPEAAHREQRRARSGLGIADFILERIASAGKNLQQRSMIASLAPEVRALLQLRDGNFDDTDLFWLSDEQWGRIEPHMPSIMPPCPARPRTEPPGAARKERPRADSGSSLRRSGDCR